MALDLAPVDGPRPSGYGSTERQPAFNPDTKSSTTADGLNRRVSERLFSQNAPRAPRSQGFSGSSARSSRVVSAGDLSRFHDDHDMLQEEPDEFDGITRDMGRQSLGHTSSGVYPNSPTAGGYGGEEEKPRLPRRLDSKGGGAGGMGGDSKAREY